jgi:hypothetical protein
VKAEGWYCDPYAIHSDRWFSDGQPTNLVRDQGVESRDEPPPRELPLPLVHVAEIQVSDGSDLLRADNAPKGKRNYAEGSGALGVGFN